MSKTYFDNWSLVQDIFQADHPMAYQHINE